MKRILFAVLMMLLASQTQAKVLVISDIDDTLKVTHVLNKAKAVGSAVDTRSRFVGMAEIFHQLKSQYSDIEFHYVSRAPKSLMKLSHKRFLKNAGFPSGELHLRDGLGEQLDMKAKVIRQLIQQTKPEFILFFGDNGQYDTLVYDEMQREFSTIPSLTYIREVYSRLDKSKFPTLPGQIGFVSSVEVMLDLISQNILPDQDYETIENIVYQQLRKDDGNEKYGKMVLAGWQDCRDFNWQWEVPNPSAQLQEIMLAINTKCR